MLMKHSKTVLIKLYGVSVVTTLVIFAMAIGLLKTSISETRDYKAMQKIDMNTDLIDAIVPLRIPMNDVKKIAEEEGWDLYKSFEENEIYPSRLIAMSTIEQFPMSRAILGYILSFLMLVIVTIYFIYQTSITIKGLKGCKNRSAEEKNE